MTLFVRTLTTRTFSSYVKIREMFGDGLGWRSERVTTLGVASVEFRDILLLGVTILLHISDGKLHCDLLLDGLISSKCSKAIALLMP